MNIKLEYPFEFEGREIKSLEFRRLKTGEIARATNRTDELKTAINVAAISAGLPVAAIEEIDAADFATISEELSDAGFFNHSTKRM